MSPNQNSQFPKEETPGLQDTARKQEEDLRRLTAHYQMLKLDKVSLERDFARFKKATMRLLSKMLHGEGKTWLGISPRNRDYLESIGFKPSDFD